MYSFAWTDVVTKEAVDSVLESGQVQDATTAQKRRVRTLLARLLEETFGPPVAEAPLAENGASELCMRVLLGHLRVHKKSRESRPVPLGCFHRQTHSSIFEAEAVAIKRIPVNLATSRALNDHPAVGHRFSMKILRERELGGHFLDRQDFENRLKKLGNSAHRLSGLFTYERSKAAVRKNRDGNLEVLLSRLAELQPGLTSYARLICALETLLKGPYHWRANVSRMTAPDSQNITPIVCPTEAQSIGILAGNTYHGAVLDLLERARSCIWVCMYHIAYSGPKHPSHPLLEALACAKERGVDVRVLLDCDKPEDPYLSTLINANAIEFLNSRGIDARYDTTEKLLHSKSIVVDDQTTVIGSHNWTDKSFFQQDDLSLMVISTDLAEQLKGRFEALWRATEVFPQDRIKPDTLKTKKI